MHLMHLKILEYGNAAAIASQTRFFYCAQGGVCAFPLLDLSTGCIIALSLTISDGRMCTRKG